LKFAWLLVAVAFLDACQSVVAPVVSGLPAPSSGDGSRELIVGFRSGTTEPDRSRVRNAYSLLAVVSVLPDVEVWRLVDGEALLRVMRDLQGASGIRVLEPNAARPLAKLSRPWWSARQGTFDWQGDGRANADPRWHLKAARFDEAWKLTMGEGVIVAVLDSGVDAAHPALRGRLLPGIDELAARGMQDRWDGRSYQGRDGNGHGTHVCGLIGAATDAASGTAGAAPGVKLLPVKVTAADGQTDDVTIAKGIVDAADAGAQVINLSIGGPSPSLIVLEALNHAFRKNVSVVIAAGNERRGVDYPAAFDGAIAVGATLENGEVADYSNAGESLVLVAPGGAMAPADEGPQILSTMPTYPCLASVRSRVPMRYGHMAGTSMATPLVAAAAALLLSREPSLTPAQVRTRLAATASDIGPAGFDPRTGYGALDVTRALLEGGRP
jgi:subtilisin family serine protease